MMNELVTQQTEVWLVIPDETASLIQSSIAESTLKRYQRLSDISFKRSFLLQKKLILWFNLQCLVAGLLHIELPLQFFVRWQVHGRV